MSIFPFDYEGQQVNAVTIDDDGWLVGTDVARALGYATADPTIQTLAAAIEALLRIAGAQDEEPAA